MVTPSADDAARLSPDTANQWPRPKRRIWFSIAGAPLAWYAHLLAGWYAAGSSCTMRSLDWHHFGPTGVRVLHAAIAVVCIGVAAAAVVVAVGCWRASTLHKVTEIHGHARPEFLAGVAMLVSSVFLLAVCYDALAQAMLPLCAWIR